MNDQTALTLPMSPVVPLADRAQRIRDLVGVARTCIIEIGRELIAAKAEVGHGNWLDWIEGEFGWDERTARRYVAVAEAFKSVTVADFTGLTIDATALYALSAPDVPPDVRDEAVRLAADGIHITKQEADAMVAKAKADKQRELEDKMRVALADYAVGEEDRQDAAVKEATKALRGDKRELAAKLKKIRDEAKNPDPDAIAAVLCRALDIPKLGNNHWQLLAQILGQGISVGNKTFAPVSAEKIRESENNLRLAAVVTEAVQALSGAPSPAALLAACYPVQRALIAEKLDGIAGWVSQCRDALATYANERV